MTSEKNTIIKTADFETKFARLINDINETKYPTKSAILSLLKGFRNELITYEPRQEIEIPMFLEVR